MPLARGLRDDPYDGVQILLTEHRRSASYYRAGQAGLRCIRVKVEQVPREIQETRSSFIERRASELAATGAFINCHAIEVALRAQGYLEAREVLDRRNKRELLTELCGRSQHVAGA